MIPPGSLRRRIFLLSIWLITPWSVSTLILNEFLQRQATQAALLRHEQAIAPVGQTFAQTLAIADWLTSSAAEVALQANGECDALRPAWEALLAPAPTFRNMALFAPDGQMLCSLVPPEQAAINAADQAWFQRAVAGEGMHVGDIQTSRITGEEVLVLGRAVRTDDQHVRWVIGLGVPLATLLPLDSIPANTIILVQTPTQLMRFDSTQHRFVPAEHEWNAMLADSASDASPYIFSRFAFSEEVALLTAFSREEALLSVRGTVAIVSMLTLLVLLIMLVIFWSTIRSWVLTPLHHLEKAAQAFAHGDLTARVHTPLGISEFDVVATTFNAMAAQQQAQIAAYQNAIATEQAERAFLEALTTLIQYALQEQEFETLLQFLADYLATLFHAEKCSITLWNEDAQSIISTATYGAHRHTSANATTPLAQRILTQSVLDAGYPLAIENVFESPFLSPESAAQLEAQSALVLPLIVSEAERLGAILILYQTPRTFSEHDIEQASLVANLCALILHKNHLLEHISEQLRELHTIHTIAAYAHPLYTMEELPTYLLEELSTTITFDMAVLIFDTSDEETTPSVTTHYAMPRDSHHQHIEFQLRQIALDTMRNQQATILAAPTMQGKSNRGQIIAVPFATTTGLRGVIAFFHHTPIYVESDISHLEGIVQQVANTLENNRLFYSVLKQQEHLQALARTLGDVEERERQMIAQTLHDESGQHLAAFSITLNLLRHAIEAHNTEDALAYLETLQRQLHTMANTLRNIMALLQPPMLIEFGLAQTLEWLATTTEERTGVHVVCTFDEIPESIPLNIQIALYRIAQEAINNAIRHAHADTITISLIWDAQERNFVLTVRDNGRGFSPDKTPRDRLGLTGMQNRAMALGGRVTFSSSPAQGTTIRATIPLGANT